MPITARSAARGGAFCELRILDGSRTWRILVRIDQDAIVIAEVFAKKSRKTPRRVLEACHRRLARYDQDASGS